MKMTTLISILSIFVSLQVHAALTTLSEGTYEGHLKDERILLMLKNAPGRSGSFLGLLMTKNKNVSLFVIDTTRTSRSTYTMTPFEVTRDGEIGIVNDDPSLIIRLKDMNGENPQFQIVSSNSGNDFGITGVMEFDKKTRYTVWKSFASGEFERGGQNKSLDIAEYNDYEGNAEAFFRTDKINGMFMLKEKIPGMFTVNAHQTLATGEVTNPYPARLGVFVHEVGVRKEAYTVNGWKDEVRTTEVNETRYHQVQYNEIYFILLNPSLGYEKDVYTQVVSRSVVQPAAPAQPAQQQRTRNGRRR